MKLMISGNLRSIANSAWVSTLEESKATQKSDEEVIRVVKFLVKEHHTTPFECVTLSFYQDSDISDSGEFMWNLADIISSGYAKVDVENSSTHIVTIDLFNFIKICKTVAKDRYLDSIYWKLFQLQDPLMASIVDDFSPPPSYFQPEDDYESALGADNGISVDLIEVHNPGSLSHLRATWRVCCPLSIAVQMLRHRTGSYNMTSGRYRTLNQDMVTVYKDVLDISNKIKSPDDSNVSDAIKQIFDKNQQAFEDYHWLMGLAKDSKKAESITNDEYKRFREFARYILPEGRMTELYVSFYYPDFQHYLMLRDSSHAQLEHAFIARKMKNLLENYLNK